MEIVTRYGVSKLGGESWKTTAAVPVALVLAALAFVLPSLWRPIPWKVDSLFYETQVLELRGTSAGHAREEVFDGRLGRSDAGRRVHAQQVKDPRWLGYSAPFYRRRWVVPALAAAAYPIVSERSLQIVSIAGYLLFALFLYALLRLRFSVLVSAVVTLTCLSLPTLRVRAVRPLTDTFGLALETACLLLGWLALRRDRRWVLPFALCVGVLSLTRDDTAIPIAATAAAAITARSARSAAVPLAGIAASLPALLILGVPLRRNIAYTLNGFEIPRDASWSFIAHRYPRAALGMAHSELDYLASHPLTGIVYAAGLVALVVVRGVPPISRAYALGGAAAAACLVYLLPQHSSFRFELVLLPFVAVGLALAVERGAARARRAPQSVSTPAT